MKYKKLVILIIIIAVALLFYWFQWRPTEIRKQCLKNTKTWAKELDKKPGEPTFATSDLNGFYRMCLVEKGLSAESVFVNTE